MRGVISSISEPVALRPLCAASGAFQYAAMSMITAPAIMMIVEVSIDLLKISRCFCDSGMRGQVRRSRRLF